MPTSIEMGAISYRYLPESPLRHGWKLAKAGTRFEASAPPDRPDGLAIKAEDAIDYNVEKYQQVCNHVQFTAKIAEHSYVYVKVRFASKNRNSPRWGWIACDTGVGEPRQESPDEWVISRIPKKNGWARFDLFLPEEVNRTYGQVEVLKFNELLGFRLRGELSISPVKLYRVMSDNKSHASVGPGPVILKNTVFKQWKELLWPVSGALLGWIVVPVLIDQYPEYLHENAWTLPLAVLCTVFCFIFPLLLHERAKHIFNKVSSIPRAGGILAVSLVVLLTIGCAFGFRTLFRYHSNHLKRVLASQLAPKQEMLACEVVSVYFEDLYRFYQEPPKYFQHLDTALRLSLTNQTGKALYIKNRKVSALAGVKWVPFKNSENGAYEPHAFGGMGKDKNGRDQFFRFDLSSNGFDYITQERPIGVDENVELWMFFISGLTRKDLSSISQFKFLFTDSAGNEFPCVSAYPPKNVRPDSIGSENGDLKILPSEPVPPTLREEPH